MAALTRLRSAISRQLSDPSGRGGSVIAAFMNRGNRALNARAIALLDLRPDSRVLDLGFGGGATIPKLLAAAGHVVGIDRSAEMVNVASRRHHDAVQDGRLELHDGDVAALPLPDGAVDRLLTVNTVYFWPDLGVAFAELRRVLSPGGRLVVGIRDGSVMEQVDRSIFTIRTPAELVAALTAVGFAEARVRSAPDGKTHLISAVSS